MLVARVDVWEVDLPFKLKFKHSLRERATSDSVIVKLTGHGGEVGYGEGLPRDYVTGETRSGTAAMIGDVFVPLLLGKRIDSWDAALEVARNLEVAARAAHPQLPERIGSARCAIELALLDLAGHSFGRSVAEIFGFPKRTWIEYSGVLGSHAGWKLAKSAFKQWVFGFRNVKLKVGVDDDLDRLALVRRIMGKGVDIRLDANCAWDATRAVRFIQEFKRHGISCVEQPVPGDDLEGLAQVTNAVSTPIMADESLCTMADARKLINTGACDMFNIRISKCGGLFGALEIAQEAIHHGLGCQLGCQVGETAILSAAGRHFALGVVGLKYLEGSYGRHLLTQDIAARDITFRRKGRAGPIKGPGLGITVVEERLRPSIVAERTYEA